MKIPDRLRSCRTMRATPFAEIAVLAERLIQLLEYKLPLVTTRNSDCCHTRNLSRFALHLIRHSRSSASVLLAAYTYLERYFTSNKQLDTTKSHHHALLLVSLMTAFKYMSEMGVKNCAWAIITDGMFDVFEVNEMERSFLAIIDYSLFVEGEETQRGWNEWRDSGDTPAVSPMISIGGSEETVCNLVECEMDAKVGSEKVQVSRWGKWKSCWRFGRTKLKSN